VDLQPSRQMERLREAESVMADSGRIVTKRSRWLFQRRKPYNVRSIEESTRFYVLNILVWRREGGTPHCRKGRRILCPILVPLQGAARRRNIAHNIMIISILLRALDLHYVAGSST
jgi:hypothetical protein